MRYSRTREVTAYLCGTEPTLSVPGVLSLIQDSMTELTGELGIDGPTVMRKYGAVLVYAKNHIKLGPLPYWKEPLLVESFISARRLASFFIDTRIVTSSGSLVAYSRLEVCGVDMQTGRLRKTDTYGVDENIPVLAPDEDISFFPRRAREPEYVESVRVRSSNIDYVHHTNNIEYIKFILNTFSVDELSALEPAELEITYANQSHEGDTLDIYRRTGDSLYYEIRRSDELILKCELIATFKPHAEETK